MSNGVLIFAHNSRDVDYATMAIISGGLAKKHLGVSVSLVTDASTLEWIENSGELKKAKNIFEHIIETDRPVVGNNRIIYDGPSSRYIPFINQNRSTAYNLSPYDRTLLIDSDFLIFSNRLGQYWDTDSSVMIAESFTNIRETDQRVFDKWVSETGPRMYWATTVMFRKSTESELFFDLVSHVRENYKYYSIIYRFNPMIYRNDIAFSIAKHMMDKFLPDVKNNLPSVLSVIDRDQLSVVKHDGNLIFLIGDELSSDNLKPVSIKGLDIHIMNKQSILRNKDTLLELI
jgi:hypothetical protein